MVKTIYLKDGDTADMVATRHLLKVTVEQRDRLTKEIVDLVSHGSLIGGQGGSFRSNRTVTVDDLTVQFRARFGALSLTDRLVLLVRG